MFDDIIEWIVDSAAVLHSKLNVSGYKYFGIKDAWNEMESFDAYIQFLSLEINTPKANILRKEMNFFMNEKFLYENSRKSIAMWFGLSGSDDLLWAVITCVNAYKLTKKPDFLYYTSMKQGNGAKKQFQRVMSYVDWPKSYVYWNSKHTYIASISNELFIVATILLSQVIPEEREKLENIALKFYDWFIHNGLYNPKNGKVSDGKDPQKNTYNPDSWTYNAGVILGACSHFYLSNGDIIHLDIGVKIINYIFKEFTHNGILFEKELNYQMDNSQKQFKGIFVQYLSAFYSTLPSKYADEKKKILSFLITNSQACKSQENSSGLANGSWSPFSEVKQFDMITTTSALNLYMAAARVYFHYTSESLAMEMPKANSVSFEEKRKRRNRRRREGRNGRKKPITVYRPKHSGNTKL